ncbi:hypothetical protein B0H10DRAFT_1991486 [Mycena sp. CBHHK59/15]|nr:hypothetical protein B0H10DRAFT_1991486 [Mycena sp. CBHHK59/15]
MNQVLQSIYSLQRHRRPPHSTSSVASRWTALVLDLPCSKSFQRRRPTITSSRTQVLQSRTAHIHSRSSYRRTRRSTLIMRSTRPSCSNDSDPTSSSSATTSSTSSISTALAKSSDAPASPASISKKKPPVVAIAGGTVGGVAAVLAFLSTLLLCRSSRYRHAKNSPSIEEAPLPPLGGAVMPIETAEQPQANNFVVAPDQDAAALADQVHMLKEQVQRLEAERAEGCTSSAGSDTASVSRSLSTMKREQRRVVRDHQDGYTVADSLVHTDSGLRLTAGRVIDELPPTYAAD